MTFIYFNSTIWALKYHFRTSCLHIFLVSKPVESTNIISGFHRAAADPVQPDPKQKTQQKSAPESKNEITCD
jgi:hypothetical protein